MIRGFCQLLSSCEQCNGVVVAKKTIGKFCFINRVNWYRVGGPMDGYRKTGLAPVSAIYLIPSTVSRRLFHYIGVTSRAFRLSFSVFKTPMRSNGPVSRPTSLNTFCREFAAGLKASRVLPNNAASDDQHRARGAILRDWYVEHEKNRNNTLFQSSP